MTIKCTERSTKIDKIWANWTGLDCNRQFCPSKCLLVCVWRHFAQLTDKMDPMYIIPKSSCEFHNDAYVISFWFGSFYFIFFGPDSLDVSLTSEDNWF